MNSEGPGKFRGFSAGSKSGPTPHRYTLNLLKDLSRDTEFVRSRSWGEFAGSKAPQMGFVFTVCDSAATDECTFWPSQPISTFGCTRPGVDRWLRCHSTGRLRGNIPDAARSYLNLRKSPIGSLDRMTLQHDLGDIEKITANAD